MFLSVFLPEKVLVHFGVPVRLHLSPWMYKRGGLVYNEWYVQVTFGGTEESQ